MVSSYAQSGKLFEERRAANGVRQIPPTSTTHGGAINTGFHKDTMDFKPLPSHGSMLGVKHASSDPDIDWLNRVPPSAQRFSPHEEHPVVVEAPYGDIPLSQLTDENTSQHSGSQSHSATGSVPKKQSLPSGRLGVQQAALARFQPRATPHRPPMTSSRFGHLSTPRQQQNLTVPSTPRANISVASSIMLYKPRRENKIERRYWSESFKSSSSTPFAPSRASDQLAGRPALLSQPSVTNTVYTPRRAGNDAGGRFSFSRAPMVDCSSELQPNMHASSRSSIAAFQVFADKYVQEQMKKFDEKTSAMQETLATIQASAVSDIIAVKTATANDLDQASKNHFLQFEQQASTLREESVQAVKATFEILRSQLIEGCLPFMREKATSILNSLTKGPSFLEMIPPWSDRRKHVIKNEAPDPWIPDRPASTMLATTKEAKNNPIEPKATSNKVVANTTEPKTTSNQLVTIAKKAKKKSIEPKTQALPRRSKRNAANQNRPKTGNFTEVEEKRVSPLVSASRRAKRQKVVKSVTTASPVLSTCKISQPTPKCDEPRGVGTGRLASGVANWMSPKPDKKVEPATTASLVRSTRTISQPTPKSDEPRGVGAGRRTPVVDKWMTPKPLKKKRKQLFCRISSEEDSMSSSESYFISSRKYLKPDDNANARSPKSSSVPSRNKLNVNTSAPESYSVFSRKKLKPDGDANASSPESYSVSSRKKLKPDGTRTTHITSSVQIKSTRRGPAAVPVSVRSKASRKKLKPASTHTAQVTSSVQVKSTGRAPAAMPVNARSEKGGLRSRKKSTTKRASAKPEAEDCFDFRF